MDIVELRQIMRDSKIIENRIISLLQLYNSGLDYPMEVQVLGFSRLKIENEQELLGRIKELSELINAKILEE